MKPIKPMAHQLVSLAHNDKTPIVFDNSDAGCVSADTEFLTPTGWKRIDQYAEGDLVAQFHPVQREIEFVAPLEYIKRPCDQMIAIAPTRGMSQRLSHEHRVLYYDKQGEHGVCSAAEFMGGLHRRGAGHYARKFCSTFSVRGTTSLTLTTPCIRVMVAVIADGHFPSPTNRCVIRLKKTRKIERLRSLLWSAEISFDERQCGGADPSFRVFTFTAPAREKVFGSTWWNADQLQLEAVADELPNWDGSADPRPSAGDRFSSFSAESADFAQYAFAAAKRPASRTFSYRDRTDEGRGLMVEYTVHARADDALIGPGDRSSVYVVPNPEGFKYCFEVPSTFLLLRHNGYIFATGNTGKTFVRIEAFRRRRAKGGGCLLVLGPRSILRSVWAADIKKFAPELTCSVATADNRAAAFEADADVYITNHDAAKWLATQKPAFFKRFSEVAIDESSAFKHHTSMRSKAMLKIIKHFQYRTCMTATPSSNSITDVFHQALLLDGGQRLGKLFFQFRQTVATPVQAGRGTNMIRWEDRDGAEDAVFALLSDIVIRHRLDDCADIPENHQFPMAYEMSKKQTKAYLEMETTQIAALGKLKTVTAINAAAVATKLLQIASGAVYESPDVYHVVDTARYELILDLCEQRKHPLVLFLWKHQRDLLVAEAEKRGLTFAVFDGETTDNERAEIVRAYQAGAYDVLFAHPKTVGHGQTLTRGTSTIWASPTYDLELAIQASSRQRRIGQTEKTETIVLIAEGTWDERAYERMLDKDAKMDSFLGLIAASVPKPAAKKSTRARVAA